MSEPAYQWGHEHFCEPDATKLYREPGRISGHGYPVKLDAPPEPDTFCSVCLQWWADPEGSEVRPPITNGESNGGDA